MKKVKWRIYFVHPLYILVVHLTILLATYYLHAVNAGNYLFGTLSDKGAKKAINYMCQNLKVNTWIATCKLGVAK